MRDLGYNVDDLEALALQGIWFAAQRYDETKAKFSSYARYRVYGYIYDCIRQEYPFPRKAFEQGIYIKPFSSNSAEMVKRIENEEVMLLGYGIVPGSSLDDVDYVNFLFRNLNEDQKKAATLYFVQGHTYTEIGNLIDCSFDRAKNLVNQSRKSIYKTALHELPSDSLLRRAFETEAFGYDDDNSGRESTAWKSVERRDRGIFSSVAE